MVKSDVDYKANSGESAKQMSRHGEDLIAYLVVALRKQYSLQICQAFLITQQEHKKNLCISAA